MARRSDSTIEVRHACSIAEDSRLLLIVAGAVAVATAQQAIRDPYQRSADIYAMKTTATGGAQRGEEIYYYKCWFCHNQYATNGGPQFGDLYKRGTFLMTGAPVTDQAVADKIRNGGPLMPAYRHTLADADMADLLAYIKSGKCCFDAEEPPPNPSTTAGRRGGAGADRASGRCSWAAHAVPCARARAWRSRASGCSSSIPGPRSGPPSIRMPTAATSSPCWSRASTRCASPSRSSSSPTSRKACASTPRRRSPRSSSNGSVTRSSCPPTPEVLGQLSSVEWLMNLPGTAQEKKVFSNQCTHCHSYQQIFRNRFDEAGWLHLVRRMGYAGGSPLINYTPLPQPNANQVLLAKWLARIRGPESAEPAGHPAAALASRRRDARRRDRIRAAATAARPARRAWRLAREHLVHHAPQPLLRACWTRARAR